MVKKKLFTSIITALVLSLSCVLPVFAADETSTGAQTATSEVPTLGGIGIESHTYILDKDGNKTDKKELKKLYPGQLLGYLIEVKNTAMPAYVRIKVTLESDVADLNINEMLKDIADGWEYINGYYYYKYPVDPGSTLKLSEKLKIPDNNELANKGFTVNVEAHAVQSRNFVPDFDSSEPWGDITIEMGNAEGIMYASERSFPIDPASSFAGTIDKRILLPYAGTLMPGDEISDRLAITSQKHAKMMLMAEYDGDFPEEKDLIRLKISAPTTDIYEGSLFSDTLKSGIEVGEYGIGASSTLTFTLSLDKKLSNKSNWLSLPVKFKIGTTIIPDPTRAPSAPVPTIVPQRPGDTIIYNYYYDSHDTYNSKPEAATPAQAVLGAMRDIPDKGVLGAIRSNIKTGDQKAAFVLFVGAVLALMTAAVLVCRKFVIKGRERS